MSLDKKTIYLISGPLGAGKSSLAEMFKQELGFTRVDGDAFFLPLENVEELGWEERLKLSWDNIIDSVCMHNSKNLDVVIDFVVENELTWFLKSISNLHVQVKYVVLIASENELADRLMKRDGGTKYLERSIRQLHQIENDPQHKPFILDTTGKTTAKVFSEVIVSDRFVVR